MGRVRCINTFIFIVIITIISNTLMRHGHHKRHLYEWFFTEAKRTTLDAQTTITSRGNSPATDVTVTKGPPTTTSTFAAQDDDPVDPDMYKQRMKNIKEYCKKNYETVLPHDPIYELLTKEVEWKNYNVDLPMIVDPIHKLMYCEMPKVGSTNWKRVLMKLTNLAKYKDVDLMDINKVRRFQENNLTKLIEYEPSKREEMLDEYYKFTFVRNPFERILSGYKDKGYRPYFPNITDKEYKLKSDEIEDFEARDLEGFEHFIDYLIERGPDTGIGGHFGVRVRHWTRYYDICHFCAVKYDFVGKIESINDDADYLIQDAGIDKLVQYPHYDKATSKDLLKQFYDPIPMHKIHDLYTVFKVDFELFEYEIPSYIIH